jgi:hypothetical protein
MYQIENQDPYVYISDCFGCQEFETGLTSSLKKGFARMSWAVFPYCSIPTGQSWEMKMSLELATGS